MLLGPYSGQTEATAHCSYLRSGAVQPACAERHRNWLHAMKLHLQQISLCGWVHVRIRAQVPTS